MATLKDLLVSGPSRFVGRIFVNDSTLVTNLNADMLDGKHASELTAAVQTITRSTNADHFLTFVDSNNSSLTEETLYTATKIKFNPSTGNLVVGGYVAVGTGATNSYLGSDSAGNIFLHNSAGYPLVADGLTVRRGTSAATTTLGTSAYPWADTYTKVLHVDSSASGAVGHIVFNRQTNPSYIQFPANSYLCFVANSTIAASNSTLSINSSTVYSGTTKTVSLGTSSYFWKDFYTQKANINNRLVIDASGYAAPYSTSVRSSGIYGVYDSHLLGQVWSMGVAYHITDNGKDPSNLYGMAYFHPNWSNDATYNTNNANKTGLGTYAGGHQIGFFGNGVLQTSIGLDCGIWSRRPANLPGVGRDNYIAYPAGGSYSTNTSTVTGALCITLPVSWTSTMLRFKISIYNYSTNTSAEYVVGGYNYSASSQWLNTFAYSLRYQVQELGNRTVRFGHNGTKCCVYIGETNSTWSFPQVSVSDVLVSFSNYGFSNWSSGWSISFVTEFGTVTETTITNPAVNNLSNIANFVPKAIISNGTTATTAAGYTYGIAGSTTSGARIPTRWFVNLDTGERNLKDGMIISFKLPTAGLGTVGECITIDNNEQHFHQVVYNTTSYLTTHFPVNTIITVQYDASYACAMYGKYDSSTGKYVHNGNTTTSVTGVWRVLTLYDSGNTDVRYMQTLYYPYKSVATGGAICRYTLCMQTPDGKLTSLTLTNNANGSTTKTMFSGYLDYRKVYYWNTTTTYAAGANMSTANVLLTHNGDLIDYRYTFNCSTTLTPRANFYIVGTVDNNGFKLDPTTPWSCSLPTSEDGKIYIYVGIIYTDASGYRGMLEEVNTAYIYKDGAVRVFAGYAEHGTPGTQGTQGTQGVRGTQGTQGVQGTQGTRGAQGTQGVIGTQGTQGVRGTQGTQGIQGTQGTQGVRGTQGTQGVRGTQGTQGVKGTQGTQGGQGTQGIQGVQGTQGIQGLQGTRGAAGTQGAAGTRGAAGTQGAAGTRGASGTQGAAGTRGASGTQGAAGTRGAAGTQGAAGTRGAAGTQGAAGTRGAAGTQGVKGTQGTQGVQGTQGLSGSSKNLTLKNTSGTAVTYNGGTAVDLSSGTYYATRSFGITSGGNDLTGGNAGQTLVKINSTNGNWAWGTPDVMGNLTILSNTSGAQFTVTWTVAGTTTQSITITANNSGAVPQNKTLSIAVPSSVVNAGYTGANPVTFVLTSGSDSITISAPYIVQYTVSGILTTGTVPNGVTKCDIFVVNGGNSGDIGYMLYYYGGRGGKNLSQTNITVSAGQSVTVYVGKGSQEVSTIPEKRGTSYNIYTGTKGEQSYITINGVTYRPAANDDNPNGTSSPTYNNGTRNPWNSADTNYYGADATKNTGGGKNRHPSSTPPDSQSHGTFYGAAGGSNELYSSDFTAFETGIASNPAVWKVKCGHGYDGIVIVRWKAS